MENPTYSRPIERIASAVRDTGRRGAPKAGCDCLQCFGYCNRREDVALRERADTIARAAISKEG